MNHQPRSVFHFTLLFIFIFSQVMAQPVSAAGISRLDGGAALQGGRSAQVQLAESRPEPAPAEKGSVIVPAQSLQSTKSALELAADLQVLGYTLPSYPVYSQQNGLSIEPLVAYNLVVDSNVLSPSSYGPSAATFGAKYCNNGSSSLTNVWAYIGNYDSDYNGTVGDAAVGSFPRRWETVPAYDPAAFAAAYSASSTNPLVGSTITDYGVTNAPFALKLASGSTSTSIDGSRYIGDLAPGDCKTQYWLVTYPRKACSSGTLCDTANSTRKDVTGGVKPEDDLWLPYFFWGTSTSGATTATSYRWNAVTMRNEISAMANKIWPNGDNKVPDKYVQAIAELVGWDTLTPSGTSNVYPGETVVSQGIWYDLGNVGAGFDNNGDFVPDRNAWLQPIGDASGYDPGCFRLVRTYGLVIVKLNDGTEQLIPFEDQMYFENIPDNNNGAVGLVFYEYAALDGVCTANLTPYQEVASGYDNEKFNADFGAGIPPLQTQESNMTFEKTGEGYISRTGTINYSLTFTLPDANTDPANVSTFTVGQPSYGMPLTYSDAVPVGLQYVAGSASTAVDMSANYAAGDVPVTLWNSKDGGATWTMGDPGSYTSSSTSNQLILQWRLQSGVTSPASGAPYTGTVTFQAVVPNTYAPVEIVNNACMQIGSGPGFVCDPHNTIVRGSNWLGGLTWQDDGAGGGVLANALQDGSESVIGRVTVNLYYDSNSDGVGDIAFGSRETLPSPVIDGYIDFDRDGITAGDTGDTGTVAGISLVNGRLDLNGVGGVTIADDGTFLGYVVIDGYIDIDRDETVNGDTGDDLAQGNYRFGALPDGSYVVTVDQNDADIPTGYTPTTRITRTAALSSTTPSVTGLDFGFGPVLVIDKYITPTTYAEGDNLDYTIKVSNMLPGTPNGSASCSYYLWANAAYGIKTDPIPHPGNEQSYWTSPSYTVGGPDERYALSNMANNVNEIGLSGYNIGNMGGSISSVQFVVNIHERVTLSTNDTFIVHVYRGDLSRTSYSYTGSYFSGPAGTEYMITQALDAATITGRTAPAAWQWSDFTNNNIELDLIANKGSPPGDYSLDAAGFIITTNQACGGSSTTLNPVPLTDAFDSTYLQYLSSSPAISSRSTSGATTTLSWSNVGPLSPGESALVHVQFKALLATSSTTNTATSANTKFADGRPANTPVTDTANVTITSLGYISGKVWHNIDNDGWVGANGYETGEVGIGDVAVRLYACQVGGVNLTTAMPSNNYGYTCTSTRVGGTWALLQTITTGAPGDYLFNNLAPGFYHVDVNSTTLPRNALTAGEFDNGSTASNQNSTTHSSTGDSQWGLQANALTDGTGVPVLFNYLSSGEHITNVNFGYQGFTPAIYGTVWQDYNGNAVRDTGDDTGIGSVTVSLVDCGADLDCATSGDNGAAVTQSTTSAGFYMFENLTTDRRYQVTVNTGTLPAGTWTNTDEDAPSSSLGVATQGTTGDSVLVTATMAAGNLLGGFDFGYHQSGTFAIGDTLWYDWDGGADWDTATEETISNVTVKLYKDNDNDGMIDANDPLVATTATMAYNVIDGYLDMDRDGTTAADSGDDGAHGGYTVIDGRLDISGNGTLGSEDDGTYLGLPVIDGYLDIDGDGLAAGDAGDDLALGQYRFMNSMTANYIVVVDRTDPDFPSGLNPTYDPDEGVQGTLCNSCDSLSTVTVGPTDLTQDFGYQPTGSGKIGDTVFRDINGNGIQDGTAELGFSGVDVQLLADWNGDGNYIVVKTATTNSSGSYLFTGLPAGTYRVLINLAANASVIPDDLFGNNYSPSNGTDTGAVVYMDKTLATATSSDLTADFGFAPPASIGDTVYQDINRNGTQDLNEPGINGVTVTLYTFTDANGNGRYDPSELGSLTSTGQTVTTATIGGAAGMYQFDGLKPGYYVVQAAPPAGSTLTADPNTDGFSCDDLHDPADPGEPNVNLCDNRDGMRLYNGTSYTGADFGYSLPGTFGDRVWIDSDNNGRLDVGERGIPNVTVTARTVVPSGATVVVNGTTYTQGQTINLYATTNSEGIYSFQNISPNAPMTWTVTVDTADVNFPSGMLNTTDPDDPDRDGDPAHDNAATVTMNASGAITAVGALLDADDDGEASDPLYLDADFGYRYGGNGALSGTICLEAVDNGICGTGVDIANASAGVDASNEVAYDAVTVYLYRWMDGDSDGIVDAGETTQIAVTQTSSSGDYSFTNLPDGVYYIVAIGAPQAGLSLDTDVNDLPYVGDDAREAVVPTTNLDGTVLSVYQVVEVSPAETVVNVDFAFRLDGSYDFGDLPEGNVGGVTYTYSTLLEGSPDGPRHLLPTTPTLYLGTGVDADLDGFAASATATGDTEENGVTIPLSAARNADAGGWMDGNGTLRFAVTGSGWLVGWIDFNGDGEFTDAGEMVVDRSVTTNAALNVDISTPYSATNLPPTSGYIYARFRLFRTQPVVEALAFSGAADGGEVEDYRWAINQDIPTPVTLSYFSARRNGSRIDFAWSTETETANLGFNLYVASGNDLLQINKELIPSQAIDSLDRQDYSFSIDLAGETFYVEDVSLDGRSERYGPFDLGQPYGARVGKNRIDYAAIQTEHRLKEAARQNALKKTLKVPAPALQPASLLWFQKDLQLTATLNLEVRKTGIYRVTYELLKDAGLDLSGVPLNKLTLMNQGKAVPIYLEGRNKFGPGAFIEFYGEALDTVYTDKNIYTLQVNRTSAGRMSSRAATPKASAQPAGSFEDTLVVDNQRVFANYAPGEDMWYDTSMLVYTAPKSWNFPFTIHGLAQPSGEATLQLVVWGVTVRAQNPDHHVIVSVNGVPAANQTFDGLLEKNITVTLPAGTLHEGENILQLTLPADTGAPNDMIALDKFSIAYQRSFQAVDGGLTFTAAGKVFKVTNLPDRNVIVYRLTESGPVRLTKMRVQASDNSYTATFAGTSRADTYLVTTASALYAPALQPERAIANLDRPAQYLIISHPDFIAGLQPLVAARQAQGFQVSVVDVTDLYAKYTYGVFDPAAIQRYITYAAKNLGTEYVLLVGGDTYDYRNYTGRNSLSFIPSLYITTSAVAKFVPVDPLYADIDGNNVPEVALGRFPVRSSADLDLMVRKTLAYQNKNYGRTAVFATDKYDGDISFKNISNDLAAYIPEGWTVEGIHLDDVPVSTARSQLIAAMNRGTALVTFTGHSSPAMWSASNLFSTSNAAALTNAGKPFVVVQWGCWNTYYIDPVNNYLVQSFLFSGDRGAAAVLGASTLTYSESEAMLGVFLTPRLTTMPIGRALKEAKLELAREHPDLSDVLLGWTLMGDPALVVEP